MFVKGSTETEFTSVEYTSDSSLYVATNTGIVAVWDTRHNTCFMHWQADQHEIGEWCSCCHAGCISQTNVCHFMHKIIAATFCAKVKRFKNI